MNAIQITEAILQAIYPFVFLLAWYNVHKHNKMVREKLYGTENRINGRLDELIASREKLAYLKGKDEGKKEGIMLAASLNVRRQIQLPEPEDEK
jgi:hypothetical protein